MPRSKMTKGTVLLQHLLIFEALESPTAHDLGSIGSADFRERANRIVKMTQISILNQLLRKLKSNIWLLKKPTHIFSSKNVMKLLIMTTKFKFGHFYGNDKVWDSNVYWMGSLFSESLSSLSGISILDNGPGYDIFLIYNL